MKSLSLSKEEKMTKSVIDASVILAILQNEKGADKAKTMLSASVISTVNIAEIMTVLARYGMDKRIVAQHITNMVSIIAPFTEEQAYTAGDLEKQNKEYGTALSLGDRACLALAKQLNSPAVTADKVWSKLDIGIKIKQIR
jgi:ribonuclease VapC